MHPTNSTDATTSIVSPAGTKVTMTNKETGEKLTATMQPAVVRAAEVFTVVIAGSAHANTFSRSEWTVEEREPDLRIWVALNGQVIYRKVAGHPLKVCIGANEFTYSSATVAKLQADPNAKLVFTSEDA